MDYIFKIEIELDDEKILAEDQYEFADIYKAIRDWFAEEGIQELDTGTHVLTFIGTKESDYGRMGDVEMSLLDEEWFLPYAKKVLWYNRDKGSDYVEDVLAINKAYLEKYGE